MVCSECNLTSAIVSACVAVILLCIRFVPLVTTNSVGCIAAVSAEHWLLSGNIAHKLPVACQAVVHLQCHCFAFEVEADVIKCVNENRESFDCCTGCATEETWLYSLQDEIFFSPLEGPHRI
jgi:hypothetical protein